MGLKGYRLWDMGQHDSTCRAPPWCSGTSGKIRATVQFKSVSCIANFETRILHSRFKGWNQALSSYGSTGLNLYSPHHSDVGGNEPVARQRGVAREHLRVHKVRVVLHVLLLQRRRVERIPTLGGDVRDVTLDVALQVAFERQTLKPVFHLIGYRLWV